jgi:hypothetical protein
MENNCLYVNSRGIIKSCDIHSPNPISTWCYDRDYLNEMISKNKMFEKMSIYVCTDVIPYFVSDILPKITVSFYLFTGDSDCRVPGGFIDIWKRPMNTILEESTCLELLNHPKLIRWYSQNCLLIHEKIEQLPIGLDYHTIANDPNKHWKGENEGTLPIEQEIILIELQKSAKPFHERELKIYVNFSVDLNNESADRTKVIRSINSDLLHLDVNFKPRTKVWKSYLDYAFALSPYGNGPDCHRTWEILNLGAIPIIQSFGSNSMFKDLPVLIVNEWHEVTEQLLLDTIEKFKNTIFNYDKLKLSYWVKNKENQLTEEEVTEEEVTEEEVTEEQHVNPFEIDIPDKDYYTNDELLEVKKKLENKREDVINLIKTSYAKNDNNFNFPLDMVIDRCTKGVCQKLIDVDGNKFPSKILYKIGNGGNKKECFICCTTNLTDGRAIKAEDIHQSLEKVGFNGYFYLFNGGFPTPRGNEMKYAGVPYCFKIFMMLEAEKLGFEKVIWIDAACYAVNNPQRLFDILNEDDAIFRQFWPYSPGIPTYENSVFKDTITLLNKLTNRDFVNSIAACSVVFGLNLKSEKIQQFINEYYEMVKLGTPFLSYFPEEVVISSIFNKDEYKHLFYNRGESSKLFIHENYMCNNFEIAKMNGYYFVQRQN